MALFFQLAKVYRGRWPSRVVSAFHVVNAAPVESEDIGEILLADIAKVLELRGAQKAILCRDLVESLNAVEEAPWSEFAKGKPLTQYKLSALLKPFRIRPTTVHYGVGAERKGAKGYKWDELKSLIAR